MSVVGIDQWLHAAVISAATFVSEDATCIVTGLLIRAGQLYWAVGLGACVFGIFLGDLGLWLLGRVFGRRVLAWSWVRARLPPSRVEHFGQWFERRGWTAVLAARFVPGTRLPVYIAAGILGRRARRFALWAFLAALVWTPVLVLLVVVLGEAVVAPIQRVYGVGWLTSTIGLAALWFIVRVAPHCVTPTGRARLWAGVQRIWRWEFWPAWLFYIPLVPWLGYLAVRYRGLMTPTAANPGIVPHGGVVGESKYAILSKLPSEWIVPSALIEPAPVAKRVDELLRVMAERGWVFPLILKPDAGQRGAGLRRVCDAAAAARYFDENLRAVLAQSYHPGPYEAGVFYYRMPVEQSGHIFSITDKQFPALVGDGVSTIESLIWRHARLRMQAATFLARMDGQAESILRRGETVPLTIAGNHCQGTLFRDGSHLITPALTDSIDAIARQFEGFFFGRFDLRYSDPNAFKAGRGFAIIELNGVASESTNLYDPSWSLLRAYRVLFRQWSILFEIGDRNRRLGHRASALTRVITDARAYYRERPMMLLAD
ncbi:MAG: VTT domain-containing protein [Phycisphaerae bacterium]|nr:VTT domain-containing protein [Phycisphaerae bacterium]